MNRIILSITFALSVVNYAYGAITDTDGDGLSDRFEQGFRVGQPGITDDLGAPVDETVSNTYNDTDGDGIPDIVEINLLYTDETINDSTALNYVTDLNGQGSGPVDNLSGQWDGCKWVSSVTECEIIRTARFSATSIMHSSTGQLVVYDGREGIVPASYNPATNTLSSTFTNRNGDLVTSTVSYDDVDTMTGTISVGTQFNNIILKRKSQLAFNENLSGIYGAQELRDDGLGLGNPITTELNPLSTAAQQVITGVNAELYHRGFPASEAEQGFFAPSVGVVAYSSADTTTGLDLDGDSFFDDTRTNAIFFGMMSLQAPVAKAGGFFRAAFDKAGFEDYDSNGSIDNITGTSDGWYGAAKGPRLTPYTMNEIRGAATVFNTTNIPLSATQISLSGGLNVDVVGGSSGKVLSDVLDFRSRFNPFEDSWDEATILAGLSGNGNQNITKVSATSTRSNYDDSAATKIANLAPNGSYSYSYTDSDSSPNAVETYTRPTTLLDPVNPDGILLNGVVMRPGIPHSAFNINEFDTAQSNTISWGAVIGATRYDVSFRVRDTSQFDRYHTVFYQTNSPSITINPNKLKAGVGYDMSIIARDNSTQRRSRTSEYKLNSAGNTTILNLTSTAEGANVAGYDPGSGGVDFDALLRPNTGSDDLGFILLHGRCSGPDQMVVSSLRRSLARNGAPTISIDNPVPVPNVFNVCGGSGSFTAYVNAVNSDPYVMTETYARVRTAMKYLKDNEGVNRVVLVGFSLGSRLASAAANHADDTVNNPVPIAGLILTGGRSGGGAPLLDTTVTIAGVTVPVLDIHMVDDDKAFTTAAARQAAHAGTSYTIDPISTVDTWSISNLTPVNDKFRHQFTGYEDLLRSKVKSWVTTTDLSVSAANPANDHNGDGKSDVMVRHTDGRWFYFPMNGRNVIIAQQGIAGITTNNSWQYQGSGDYNGDGKADVLVRHSDGRWFYFPMNGRGVITAQQGIAGITTNNSWQYQGSGDMNGDGKDDVLVRHTDGRWFYFPMNGRGVIVAQQGIAHLTTNTSWQFAGMGDLNGDGKDDVMVRHTDGRWFYFPMNGRNVLIAQQGIAGITTNTSWQFAGIGDMNGDSKDDVLVRHTDGRWFYFPMNGRSVIVAQQGIAFITTNTSWQFSGMRDMNGDGKDDVLVRHTDGRWFYFPMNGRNVIIAQQGIAGITTNTAWGVLP